MTEFIHSQNSFANGEISPEFYLTRNVNGLAYMENMDVLDGGGITKRPGLQDITNLSGKARLFSFDMSEQEKYVLVFTNFSINIFCDDNLIYTLISPWSDAQLSRIQFASRGNSVIFVHPDICPYILTKSGNDFSLNKFSFYDTTGINSQMPLMQYDEMRGVYLTVSAGTSGVKSATLTTSKNYWMPNNIGTIVCFENQKWEITEYVSPTVVRVRSAYEYALPQNQIANWTESAFDNRHGWPHAISFHQDRLVFGGTYSAPGGIWMSCVADHHNFNVGTGLDDEAIITTLLSKERQQICNLISCDKLQVLTSCGEWAIADKPITPSNMNIVQHTTVGSPTESCLIPQKIEGETVFISNTLTDIRKLSLDALGDKYNADDLCAFAKHLIKQPVDISYNKVLKHLYVVNADGTMAVLHQDSAHGISAWGRYTTYGKFISVTTCGNDTFVILEYNNAYKLSKFSNTVLNDSGIYDISFRASGMPMNFSGHRPNHLRLRKINLRLWETKDIFINNMRVELPNEIYAPYGEPFSGDISMNFLGSCVDESVSPWTIHGNQPMPVTVLSVTVYGQYEI